MDALSEDIRRIEVAPGVHLAVKVGGTVGRPAVVFSNSLAADISTWDEVAERLAPYARIVRYDTRGHGRSDMPGEGCDIARLGADVLAVLDALDIGKAVMCGLSLGGLTAMWLAANAPARTAGIVLANTAASFPPATMWVDRAKAVLEGGYVGPLVGPTLERWFTERFRAAAPERVAEVGQVIGTTPAAGYAACCQVLAATDMMPELARVACPALVVVGAHDPSTPPARGQELAGAIPHAEMVTLDAAHLSSVEAAGAFADALIRFLSRVPSA